MPAEPLLRALLRWSPRYTSGDERRIP